MMLLEEEDGLVSAKDTTEPFLLAGFPISPLPDVRLPNLNEETKTNLKFDNFRLRKSESTI